jgi:hypothetical protein
MAGERSEYRNAARRLRSAAGRAKAPSSRHAKDFSDPLNCPTGFRILREDFRQARSVYPAGFHDLKREDDRALIFLQKLTDILCLLRCERCEHRSLVAVLHGAIFSPCTPSENAGHLLPDISATSIRLRKTVQPCRHAGGISAGNPKAVERARRLRRAEDYRRRRTSGATAAAHIARRQQPDDGIKRMVKL